MKKYNLLVFDWDGTIVDSVSLSLEATKKTALDLGLPMPTITEFNKYYGLSLETMQQQLFPTVDYTSFVKTFQCHFNEEKLATNFFPGAIETLNHLKEQNFTLAIATNRPHKSLQQALERAKIKHLFATTRSPDNYFPKPHPDMLITLLEELTHHPENTVMIGDTTFDMQFAQNAKVDALAVTYGHNKKEQLLEHKPIGFIDNIQDLKNFFTLKN
jgi:phosphoglycolate phosphatase